MANHQPYPRPSIDLDNGWYQLNVLAEMVDKERIFEFLITPISEPAVADTFKSFVLIKTPKQTINLTNKW